MDETNRHLKQYIDVLIVKLLEMDTSGEALRAVNAKFNAELDPM